MHTYINPYIHTYKKRRKKGKHSPIAPSVQGPFQSMGNFLVPVSVERSWYECSDCDITDIGRKEGRKCFI